MRFSFFSVRFGLGLMCCAVSVAAQPVWWARYGVTTVQPADDYAVANLGQLKAVASAAAFEMNLRFSGGAGTTVNNLVGPWWQPAGSGVIRDDYATVNQGQLKTVAEPFYARLQALGYTGTPLGAGQTRPWTSGASDDDSYALVNLGQLKHVFSFHILVAGVTDTDADGLSDSWETSWFGAGNLSQTSAGNPDGDSLSNRAESLAGTNPTIAADASATAIAALALIVYSP